MSYRHDRYCEHLSGDQLKHRIRDIFLTLWTLTPDAKLGMLSMDSRGLRWMELWTHVLEELALRGQGLTEDILHREPMPNFVGTLAKRAASSLQRVPTEGCLLKFGKPQFMKEMYERGAIRIQPATFYRRPDMNGAVRDDELALDASVRVEHFPDSAAAESGQPDAEIRVDVRFEHGNDYWLYCVSSTVAPRHFVDFEAEACVVIKDPPRFIQALESAFAKNLPSAAMWHGKVGYVDPLRFHSLELNVSRAKHFRYWYQREYRVIWNPEHSTQPLSHVDIDIGSMNEYAELIHI
jgi:hypothetical protein